MDLKSSAQAPVVSVGARGVCPARAVLDPPPHGCSWAAASPSRWPCFHAGFHSSPLFFLSRKFLKSLIRKQPQELLLVIGTGVSAAVAPGIPALCSWRSCIEAVIEAAEQLEVLHPGDVAEFRRKVTKDGDLLVVAHDLIRKMSPVSAFQVSAAGLPGAAWLGVRLVNQESRA